MDVERAFGSGSSYVDVVELARNVLLYAGRGRMALTLAEQSGRTGIVVTAIDEGPGIPDVAMTQRSPFTVALGCAFR